MSAGDIFVRDADTEIATLRARIAELEQQLEKESFYARKQKALRVEANSKLAALRELLYDAYELGQTDAAGNGTLAGVAYKDKKQVTAALLGDKK